MPSGRPTLPDLNFQIDGAAAERLAASPMLLFGLRVADAANEQPAAIQTVILRCQIRIEPGRRRYSPEQQQRLLDLFGTPERWGQTVRPMLWTHASVVVPSFVGSTIVDLPVPCSYDFNLAATKYFDALDDDKIPLCFLFSGTTFYATENGNLQAMQIPWEKEAYFGLPAATWKAMMELYYPNTAWLGLHRDTFERLREYRRQEGLLTWEQTVERLLHQSREAVTP
jgi:hypothetical protein